MIRLPIDTKSLYFNIKNDNSSGHTPTVATPLKKACGNDKVENILTIKNKEINISSKNNLIELLVKHSKSKVLIKNMYVFDKLMVNGKCILIDCSFGCYIKEEIDDTKVQFGRLKLHYPSKLIYSDDDVDINNKKVYKAISEKLNNYAFIIRAFEYFPETDVLNFDALIVGENDIPYSKVFINEKGAGNKFNVIFNENADDYDREIVALRRKYGDIVNPYNYLEYIKDIKNIAFDLIKAKLKVKIECISDQFPYSLFDFCYKTKGITKYGILRTTATRNNYFNLSFMQQAFMMRYAEDVNIFLVSNVFDSPCLRIFKYDDLSNLQMSINSIKYEEE